MASQAACSCSGPAALKMAPHTPPPIFSDVFAALTMASTCIFVISFWTMENGIVLNLQAVYFILLF
jgi:hypothetical protein